MDLNIELRNISKRFGDELLFHDISMNIQSPSSTALLGINGSGKSTLLQIIATYVIPTKGEVIYTKNDQRIDPEEVYQHISFCAPYLELIEEMTLLEFLNYHFTFKKPLITVNEMIEYIGLGTSSGKQIEKFSSGMKQRVKLAQSVFADTALLCLDEPCTNLDADGIALYHRMIEQFGRHRILVVASNDIDEYDVCKERFSVR